MKLTATAARAAGRTLLCSSLLALTVLAGGLATTTPARADALLSAPASVSMSGAEKLRRLDIMLMVTALRCRTGADNFNADYGEFETNHLGELNAASDELKADLAHTYGAAGAGRALDRLSTTIANNYGQGHPWLSCADLKMVAHNLAEVHGRTTLEEAADQLLSTTSPPRFALASR